MTAEPNPTAAHPARWLDAQRLRLYPRVVLAAITAGVVLAIAAGSGATTLTGRLGGDFPAFYAAGRIVARGDAAHLYDWDAQARAQTDLFPHAQGTSFLAFAYPPYVALLYRPFAALPYRLAYLLHTLAMSAALLATAWSLGSIVPRVRRYAFEGFCMSVAFLPMFIALCGGQPTPLLGLALVAALVASARGRDLLAGACLGILWIKPQYAVPFIAWFAVAGRPRVLPSALAAGVLAYVAGAWLQGWSWPLDYAQQLWRFHRIDQHVNAIHSIGLLGVSEALFGGGDARAIALGGVLMASAALVLLGTLRRATTLDLRLAAAIPLVILLEPHAMYYDAGLLVPSCAIVAGRLGRNALLPLGVIFTSGMGAPFGAVLGVNPLVVTVVATAVLCVAVLRSVGPSVQNSASAGT